MKKIFAILLAVTLLASMATVASAESTTTLTTTVPAATYTLVIPADQEIEFAATETKIGSIQVVESLGFSEGKNLAVTAKYSAFEAENVVTKIPFSLEMEAKARDAFNPKYSRKVWSSDTSICFLGQDDGTVEAMATEEFEYYFNGWDFGDAFVKDIYLCVKSDAWGKALAGNYTATITFTAEVVVDQ